MAEKILVTHEQRFTKQENYKKTAEEFIHKAKLGTLYVAAGGGTLFGLDHKRLYLAAVVAKYSSALSIVFTILHRLVRYYSHIEQEHSNIRKGSKSHEKYNRIARLALYISGYAPCLSLAILLLVEKFILHGEVNNDVINFIFSFTSGLPLGINLLCVSMKKTTHSKVKKYIPNPNGKGENLGEGI
jgi:hypothetical protein